MSECVGCVEEEEEEQEGVSKKREDSFFFSRANLAINQFDQEEICQVVKKISKQTNGATVSENRTEAVGTGRIQLFPDITVGRRDAEM